MILSEKGGRCRCRCRCGPLLHFLAVPKVVAVRCDWTLVKGKKGSHIADAELRVSCQPPSPAMVLSLFILSFFYFRYSLATIRAGPDVLAQQYALATSTSMPFPTKTMTTADTQDHIVRLWSVGKGRIQDNPQNLDFVADPFPNKPPPGTKSPTSSTGPVLRVTYPEGSFSHDTGGAQLYTLWNTTDGTSFNTMMVTYEVAFDAGFDWVKGGKLPGLRGGLNSNGCSGGNKSDGLECFSSRIMWRASGLGEGAFLSLFILAFINQIYCRLRIHPYDERSMFQRRYHLQF